MAALISALRGPVGTAGGLPNYLITCSGKAAAYLAFIASGENRTIVANRLKQKM